MRLNYLLQRLKFRISIDGLSGTLRDMLFINRDIVVVEKETNFNLQIKNDESLEYIIADMDNSQMVEKKFNLPLFHHYACKNCQTLIATKNDACVGFIRWTRDNNFWDLVKFEILLEPDEAYMFDFFIFPEYRGGSAVMEISNLVINHLRSIGVSKFYGYYFMDNLQALWWHRAILRASEIKRIKAHKLLTIDVIDGKILL